MVDLKSPETGVVVSVNDAAAEVLTAGGWEPVKAPAKSSAKK